MRIKITQHGTQGFRADCTDLPGSPPVGSGPTPEAALVELFFMMLFLRTTGGINEAVSQDETWLKFLSYAKGYGMTCENYRPLIAIENPLAQTPSVPDQIKKAVDEIISRESHIPDETTGQDCLSREQLEELLNRYFNQPFELAGSVAKEVEPVDPSIISKPVMTDEECFDADLGLAIYWGLVNKKWLRHSSTTEQDRLKSVTGIVARAIANVRARNTRDPQSRADGEPCRHPGCASHISHPCEGCGRTGARGTYLANRFRSDIENYSLPPTSERAEDNGSSPNTPGPQTTEPTDIPPVVHAPVKEKFGAPSGIVRAAQDDYDALQQESEQLITSIKDRTTLFVQDNAMVAGRALGIGEGYRLIEAAMLIGASIAMERSISPVNLDQLEHIFRAAGEAQKTCPQCDQGPQVGETTPHVGPVKCKEPCARGLPDSEKRDQ